MPYAHDTFHVPEARQYDDMSVQNRLEALSFSLSPNERAALESFLLLCSGGTLETTSLLESLHWWALCGYTYRGCLDALITYKFKGGQSSFAIKFFEEALSTGNLSYVFNSPVKSISDRGDKVTLTTRDGRQYTGARLISTIPLNVLNTVTFDPPLDAQRAAAMGIGHVNQCVKVHAEVSSRDMRSWTGISYPFNRLAYAIGDGTTPQGNTHIVCFGGFFNHIQPEENVDETKKTVENLAPGKMDIQRLVCYLTPRPNIKPNTDYKRSSTTGARMNSPKEHGSSLPLSSCPALWRRCVVDMETFSLRTRIGRLDGVALLMVPLKKARERL